MASPVVTARFLHVSDLHFEAGRDAEIEIELSRPLEKLDLEMRLSRPEGSIEGPPRFAGILQSPLTDSNLRPPPYHEQAEGLVWLGAASLAGLRRDPHLKRTLGAGMYLTLDLTNSRGRETASGTLGP